MLLNYYSLIKLTKELQHLVGLGIIDVFTQEKDSVIIEFDSEEEVFLDFSTDNKYSSCFIRTDFKRAGKNTVNLFPELVGEIVQKIELLDFDRTIEITLINSILYLQLFGRGSSNLILTKNNYQILDSLENSKELIGTDFDKKQNILVLNNDETVFNSLAKLPFIMGNKLANEFIFRNNIDKNILIKDLKIDINKLVNEFIYLILKDTNYLYFTDNRYLFSPIELKSLNNAKLIQTYNSLSDGIKWAKIKSMNDDKINEEKKGISRLIDNELKKRKAKYKQSSNFHSLIKLANDYRLYGDILMSTANPKSSSGDKLETVDWEGNPIIIPLDPKMNILDNANKYYSKARKTQKDAKIKEQDLPEVKLKLDLYLNIQEEYESVLNLKDIKEFKQKYAKELNFKIDKKMEQESKFRQFEYEGYQIFVGKSASNNDELTMKFARPNDIWLHARGVPGSHTVIKINPKDKLKKEVLEVAAALAAYYSQSRKAGLVPVIYTEKKYVRKPKGANAGSVLVQKENVIMVKPISPEELFG